ncbi:hypothetical protein BST36_06270 [Mycolicibacterium moriokaense]|uniref:Glycosyltransferase RgtA/B/C/D-like domain-containing protein n=1 Tax=Mycolicibacterium moriokaense TaxID=39691 RepID=A0AAD1HBV4_9MYCO|nr:hypothetical protein [Mycolicibacterium moriokaense]MCV7039788.1 hypothetical protein [Mycolicibacterium moriokaense]ORB25640.1 hypothetical protein BST36_06270 [Mycolicibacterium moriokaense]BBX01764.1 hypothetical protein MMOR_27000 [Mycolicibacterium moriokaense]
MTVWAVLSIAVLSGAVTTIGFGALLFPSKASAGERLLGGALLTVGAVVVGVRVLGAIGALSTTVVLGAGVVVSATVVAAVYIRGLPWLRVRPPVSVETVPVLLVAGGGLAIATMAAYLLPVWQFDALGYHLPYVNFTLQHGTLADVPVDVPYVSTYPHNVENVFVAWRALLPDDRLVELGHLPFGLLGGLAIAVIARGQGARPATATAAGAAWLTLPAVFLQLPTNYVDVASAALLLTAIAFVLGPVDRTRMLLAATALGLFVGSKPSTPVAALIVFAALVVVAWRAASWRTLGVAGLLVLVLGGETYVTNIVRQGNPVWPVRIDVGPIHLPGRYPMSELLASGAGAPRASGNLIERVVTSWTTIWPPVPAFDMRVGGLGLLFLAALPVALFRAARTRSVLVALVFSSTLATPDPAVARFVLPFAALVLAFAAPALDHRRIGRAARVAVFGLVALVAAHSLYVAYPGLTGEGPPLRDYFGMTDDERRRAVGAEGPPTKFIDAVEQVGPGEITLFDHTLELPYYAWPPDLSRSAARIPDDVTAEAADRLVHDDNVRLLFVGRNTAAGAAVRRDLPSFVRLFDCRFSACSVYLRR